MIQTPDEEPTQPADGASRRKLADMLSEPAFERVGPYRVVCLLGRGGMGEVLLAERDDGTFQQQVAIKVLRGGGADLSLRSRMRLERQLLAGLQHPGIARLLDGGDLPNGNPYLVLEYVRGETLMRACENRQLGLRQRLNLFLAICDAVQYAHQQLIVHRDIKPDNILLTEDGHPKLLDFGIAKLIEQPEPGDSTTTRVGSRALTPAYCSPEQLRGEAITVATDVYLLGLLLYELVCDRQAQPVPSSSRPSDVESIVCDKRPPPPSQAEGVAPARQRQLRGDIDTIVTRALAKRPERRYPSVTALADDVRAHLGRRPIAARKDSRLYLLKLFVRRNALASAAAVVIVMLLAGLLWRELSLRSEAEVARDEARQQAARAELALGDAQQQREQAEAISRFVEGMLVRAGNQSGGKGPQARIVDALEPAWAEAGGLVDSSIEQYATLAAVIARVHTSLGQYRVAYDIASEALATASPQLDPTHERMLDLRIELGRTSSATGRPEESLAHREFVHQQMRARYGAGSDPELKALYSLAAIAQHLGDGVRAASLLAEGVESARRVQGDDSEAALRMLQRQAENLDDRGEAPAAQTQFMQIVSRRIARNEASHDDVINGLLRISLTLSSQGQFAVAARALQWLDALLIALGGVGNTDRVSGLTNLAAIQLASGDSDGMRATLDIAIPLVEQQLGKDHPALRHLRQSEAILAGASGDHARSQALLAPLLAALQSSLGTTSWQALQAESRLWLARARLGDAGRAAAEMDRLIGQLATVVEPSPALAWVLANARQQHAEARWLAGEEPGLQAMEDDLQRALAKNSRFDFSTRELLQVLARIYQRAADAANLARIDALLALPPDDREADAWLRGLTLPPTP